MVRNMIVGTAAAALAFTGAAAAQQQPAQQSVTRAAVVAQLNTAFKTIDTNHDGFITIEEVTVFYRFLTKTSDTNGDGYVSLQEWLGATEGE